ncbi:unnamed protein product, partial [Darwinula stevensoni]
MDYGDLLNLLRSIACMDEEARKQVLDSTARMRQDDRDYLLTSIAHMEAAILEKVLSSIGKKIDFLFQTVISSHYIAFGQGCRVSHPSDHGPGRDLKGPAIGSKTLSRGLLQQL